MPPSRTDAPEGADFLPGGGWAFEQGLRVAALDHDRDGGGVEPGQDVAAAHAQREAVAPARRFATLAR